MLTERNMILLPNIPALFIKSLIVRACVRACVCVCACACACVCFTKHFGLVYEVTVCVWGGGGGRVCTENGSIDGRVFLKTSICNKDDEKRS